MRVFRRIMLSGGSVLDIDSLPETQKLYYTATERLQPSRYDLGDTIIASKWSPATQDGIIVCRGDITKIGYHAFSNIKGLTSIIIPDNVVYIGDYAFLGTNLISIEIPDNVTSIGEEVFSYCSSLLNMIVSDNNVEYDSRDNCNAIIHTSTNKLLYGCSSTIIPDSVVAIGRRAFKGCSSLIKIVIPESITSIGYGAFKGCTSLTSITIPDSVTSIGDYALASVSGSLMIDSKVVAAHYNLSNYPAHAGWLIDSNFTELIIGNNVLGIGSNALRDCHSLIDVKIGDSVENISDQAFCNCTSLTSVNIPDSVTHIGNNTFQDCTSLKSIIIPDSVTHIGLYAFSRCSSLTSVTIPDSVTAIYDGVFGGCSSLTSVTIPDSVTEIGKYAFQNCTSLTNITIPNSVTSIGERVFSGCVALPVIDGIRYADTYLVEVVDKTRTSYTIKPGTRFIGSNAFEDCSSLTSVTIPDSVTEIGSRVFNGCTSLKNVTIPNSVTSIGHRAFYDCTGELIINSKKLVETNYTTSDCPMNNSNGWLYNAKFTKLTIGNSVTSIGNYAFYGCDNLTSVTIPDSIASIGERAFCNCYWLTSVTIPDSVTDIGYEAFAGFDGELIINNKKLVETEYSIGAYPSMDWLHNAKFTKLTIGNGVTSIGKYAFYQFTSLTSVTIPESVTSIGYYAFNSCTSLTSVYCKATTPPTLGNSIVFNNNGSGRIIYVPTGSVDTYKGATNWSEHADSIVGYDFE